MKNARKNTTPPTAAPILPAFGVGEELSGDGLLVGSAGSGGWCEVSMGADAVLTELEERVLTVGDEAGFSAIVPVLSLVVVEETDGVGREGGVRSGALFKGTSLSTYSQLEDNQLTHVWPTPQHS